MSARIKSKELADKAVRAPVRRWFMAPTHVQSLEVLALHEPDFGVGTSRCDVPARESAGGIVTPLNAARTAQRAVPTMFRGSMRENLFRRILSMESPSTALRAPSPPPGEKDGMRGYAGRTVLAFGARSTSLCYIKPLREHLQTLPPNWRLGSRRNLHAGSVRYVAQPSRLQVGGASQPRVLTHGLSIPGAIIKMPTAYLTGRRFNNPNQ